MKLLTFEISYQEYERENNVCIYTCIYIYTHIYRYVYTYIYVLYIHTYIYDILPEYEKEKRMQEGGRGSEGKFWKFSELSWLMNIPDEMKSVSYLNMKSVSHLNMKSVSHLNMTSQHVEMWDTLHVEMWDTLHLEIWDTLHVACWDIPPGIWEREKSFSHLMGGETEGGATYRSVDGSSLYFATL